MADLGQIAESLEIKLDVPNSDLAFQRKRKVLGKKRRVWLTEETQEQKGVYTSLYDKGLINPLNQSDSSIRSINPIDKTENKKGVYKTPLVGLRDLRSNPLKLIRLLHYLSLDNEDRITKKITRTWLATTLKIAESSVRTALRFLRANGIIQRSNIISGKQGGVYYQIHEQIFNELSDNINKGLIKPFIALENFDNKKGSNSSSSYNNITTTTIRSLNDSTKKISWETVDITPLEKIGFTIKHLLQLKDKNTPEIVQESINHFSFALENNEKISTHNKPLNMFMGVLCKGHAWVESGYEHPKDRALRELLERKILEKEKREVQKKELYELFFCEWLDTFSEQELQELYKRLTPNEVFKYKSKDNIQTRAILSKYFKDNIWPEKHKKYDLDKHEQ